MSTDNINPAHYKKGEVECITAIESATADMQGIEAVCIGNAIKYLWRWKDKGGVESLNKAQWYINHLIIYKTREAADRTLPASVRG